VPSDLSRSSSLFAVYITIFTLQEWRAGCFRPMADNRMLQAVGQVRCYSAMTLVPHLQSLILKIRPMLRRGGAIGKSEWFVGLRDRYGRSLDWGDKLHFARE